MNNEEIKRDVDRLRYELSGKASDEDLRRLRSKEKENEERIRSFESEIQELRVRLDDLVGVGGIERSRLLEDVRAELKAELEARRSSRLAGSATGPAR